MCVRVFESYVLKALFILKMAAINVKILKIFSLAIMLFENESFQCHFIYCPRNSTLFNLECSEAALIFGSVITYTEYCLSAAW
jgi:hypothetical protein